MADSKKYDGSQWEHSLRKLTTATEAVENPLYSDGTAITAYTIKGNTVQNGTPTPSNPVPVVGVGELETTGEHTGEYKIPISNDGVTTNIYLGSTQTVRQIKKLVLTGNESGWTMGASNVGKRFGYRVLDVVESNTSKVNSILSHLPLTVSGGTNKYPNTYTIGSDLTLLIVLDSTYTSLNQFLDWLRGQYNNGTPVTLWYRTATPETAAVNEPLMKIGNYADTLSNATAIPTTEGANSITVDTTVQPSEFTATWTGWHDASVKEWDGSNWS